MAALGLFNYIAALLLFLFGLYVMMTDNNLMRKVIGMVILQSGVILFYVSLSVKQGAQIPIITEAMKQASIDPNTLANPLPHALMLTAIVVGASTLGVALVLITSIHRKYDSIEEDEILDSLKKNKTGESRG